MYTIEEIRNMTFEEQEAVRRSLGRKILTRVLLPKVALAAILIAGSRYTKNRSYQASVTEH